MDIPIEQDEFTLKVRIHPFRRSILPTSSGPYYINKVYFGSDVQEYNIKVLRRGAEQLVHRGETDQDILAEPVLINKLEDVYVDFRGSKSTDVTLVCCPAKG